MQWECFLIFILFYYFFKFSPCPCLAPVLFLKPLYSHPIAVISYLAPFLPPVRSLPPIASILSKYT